MAKDKLTEYSATNASNDVIGDISVAEGMLPSAVNNALREQMTHLKNFADGTDGINVLSLDDDDASASIKIQAPSAVTTTTTLTLPDGDGDAGAMLQTDGSGQLAWSTAYRNRNLILNGSMQVAQRGDVTGITGSSYGGPDRFELNASSIGTFTISQSSTAPSGFKNSWKVDCTTADASPASGDLLRVSYRIEGQDLQQLAYGTSDAKTITLSFYVRSNKTGTYNVQFQQIDNSFKQAVLSYTIDAADTWEFKSITIAGDTAGSIDNDNGDGLALFWILGAGSNFTSGSERSTYTAFSNGDIAPTQTVNLADNTANEWMITGVQLEVGEQATPFEHRSYGDELAACQRYYYQLTSQLAYRRYGMSTYDTSTNYSALIPFPVQMRTTPSLSTTGTASDYAVYALNSVKASNAVPSLGDSTVFNALLSGVTASSTAGAAGTLLDNNAAGTFLGFSAEL